MNPYYSAAIKLRIIMANWDKEIEWNQRAHLLQLIELGGVQDAAEQLQEWRITA
jgi:hypothetical protein